MKPNPNTKIKFMNRVIGLLLMFYSLSGALAGPLVTYKLKWSYGKLPIEIKTVRGPLTEQNRIGENGRYNSELKLPILQSLKNDSISLGDNEKAVLYLLVKNTGSKKLRFSVAPHSTEPGASALGFYFNCLCNGHIYEVGPNEVWYRVMVLKTSKQGKDSIVTLDHEIFEVTPNSKRKPQSHLHHKSDTVDHF